MTRGTAGPQSPAAPEVPSLTTPATRVPHGGDIVPRFDGYNERGRAVATIFAAMAEDTGRLVLELVEAGWPIGVARTSAGSWWSTTCLKALRDGLAEGDRRARTAS